MTRTHLPADDRHLAAKQLRAAASNAMLGGDRDVSAAALALANIVEYGAASWSLVELETALVDMKQRFINAGGAL